MDKIGHIEINITGKKGELTLGPANYDIREIREVLEQVESLLIPGEKKDRPLISYQMEEGSVRNIFKTSLQYVIGFNAIIGQVVQHNSVDFLDLPTARAIEKFQEAALRKDYSFEIKTSLSDSNKLNIDKSTGFFRKEVIWADAEFYFYGKITNMGGKERSNIHVSTDDLGIIVIQTNKEYLSELEKNLLYKTYGVRAAGKQNIETGEIDRNTLKFIELIDFNPKYDEKYLKKLRNHASGNWLRNVDADQWLKELRGYDA